MKRTMTVLGLCMTMLAPGFAQARHHRARNVAIGVGAAAVAHHEYKKHKEKKAERQMEQQPQQQPPAQQP